MCVFFSLNPGGAGEPCKILPTPEQCRNKVLIKAKVGRFKEKKKDKEGDKAGSGSGAAATAGEDEDEEENIDELDDLVAIKGAKLKSLHDSIADKRAEIIHSLKESKVEKVATKHGALLLKYCEDKLIRTYPDNFRVDSSNYDPMTAWNFGYV
jgi:hypothetical protein